MLNLFSMFRFTIEKRDAGTAPPRIPEFCLSSGGVAQEATCGAVKPRVAQGHGICGKDHGVRKVRRDGPLYPEVWCCSHEVVA